MLFRRLQVLWTTWQCPWLSDHLSHFLSLFLLGLGSWRAAGTSLIRRAARTGCSHHPIPYLASASPLQRGSFTLHRPNLQDQIVVILSHPSMTKVKDTPTRGRNYQNLNLTVNSTKAESTSRALGTKILAWDFPLVHIVLTKIPSLSVRSRERP